MDQSDHDRLRDTLFAVTALRVSMELAVKTDSNSVWKYASYRSFMLKYNQLVDHVQAISPVQVPINKYVIEKVRSAGDTLGIEQKEQFEAVHLDVSILESFLAARIDLPAQKAEGLRNFFEASLRKGLHREPATEREVQDVVETMLIGRGMQKGIDYDREVGRVKISVKEVVPDFILAPLSLAIEVKLSKRQGQPKELVDEINADIRSYSKRYSRILFIVYDLGTIRDSAEFAHDLESSGNVDVIVVKH